MQLNRRDFIRSAAVTGAGALLSRSLAAQEAAAGAKDEITVALIGIGNQGKKLLEYGYKIPGVRFVAVCDIWKQQNQRRGKNYLKAQMKRDKKPQDQIDGLGTYTDYREMLEKEKDLDAVIVATPDFSHAEHAITCLEAGKHVYCEKPIATNFEEAVEVVKLANAKGVKHGTVQDKLFLPGLKKIAFLRDSGFFGRILSVRGEFGYWVFEGGWQEAQRPSWNYRDEDGGGIILDMVCHWRYVLDNLFGNVQSVVCIGNTDIPERFDEQGKKYKATADDSAYATFQLEGGVIAHINMSWVTRVYRDDLVTFQVDGTHGSAVAGLTDCMIQARQATPRPVWNPDEKRLHDFYGDWQKLPDNVTYDNGFKEQWEMFIRHVYEDAPYKFTLLEGAKGVQLAECALKSWKERRWIDVAPIKA